jgi:alpha-L-fucosidase
MPAKRHSIALLITTVGLCSHFSASDFARAADLDEIANLKPPTVKLEGKYQVQGERTQDPGAQWFPQAGLGLFMHWGPESAQGSGEPWTCMVTEGGPEKSGIGPVKKYGFHPPSEFWDVARKWNPDKYNPDLWMKAAKEAGFTYAVLTTKHHLGYAIWPSKHGEMGVTQYMSGRDLLQPYIDACRKNGIKVGFYYSGMDWFFDREYSNFSRIPGKFLNWRHEEVPSIPARPKEHHDAFRQFDEGQARELLTNYGKIDLWWPDGSSPFNVQKIREMQPGIVINNRMCNWFGDYATPEGGFLAISRLEKNLPILEAILDKGWWWENCNVYNGGSWHYNPGSEKVSEAGRILWELAIARSFGGNLLADIAPRPNGEMPDQFYAECKKMAGWMKHSRAAIFGIEGGAVFPKLCNVPVTISGKNWYLLSPPNHWNAHYGFPARIDTIALKDVSRPEEVVLLRTGEALPFDYDEASRTMTLKIPPAQRTELVDVVKVVLPEQEGAKHRLASLAANPQYFMRKPSLSPPFLVCVAVATIISSLLASPSTSYETEEQRDARMKWFKDARFGMFIHWGVYSVLAGEWQGKQIAGIGEWIYKHGEIPSVLAKSSGEI